MRRRADFFARGAAGLKSDRQGAGAMFLRGPSTTGKIGAAMIGRVVKAALFCQLYPYARLCSGHFVTSQLRPNEGKMGQACPQKGPEYDFSDRRNGW